MITIGEIHYQACGSLLHSVQTGSPAFNSVFGASLFDYLQQNVDAADTFNQGMANVSPMLAYAVLMAYDFAGISSIVDVGGGQGKLLEKILQFNPDITGTGRSREQSKALATMQEQTLLLRYRRLLQLGSTRSRRLPFMRGVIHDWDDPRAIRILRNCRRAMAWKGRVLIVDMVVPDTDAMSFSKFLDLNMLAMTGGRERTKAEFHALLDAADYKLTRIIPTVAPQSVIEAFTK